MKEIKYTPEQLRDFKKSELLEDLIATETVIEEIWRYHPENPKRLDILKEYDKLKVIKADIENELKTL
jgi:hypothetical protein|tara:strand:+ start:110 stop:313 length:204 start_codon:yes stop_codon:yes gene_type:complete